MIPLWLVDLELVSEPADSYVGVTSSTSKSAPDFGMSSSIVGTTVMKGLGAIQDDTISGWSKYRSMLGKKIAELDLAPGVNRAEMVSAIEGHILAYGETIGKHQGPRVNQFGAPLTGR